MKLAEIIEKYIPGDWGNEVPGNENPYQVSCIRGADIVPIENVDYSEIPYRYISERSYNTRLLSVGDIIIEKSGGSPTQSTGRVSIVTEDLLKERQNIVCSNFCEAFRVKSSWNPWYVYYYFRFIYDQGVFFNFEGKTSGLKNLQMDNAFSSIEIEEFDRSIQDKVANAILDLDTKIAINHQINRKLEAMAKQIYDYWFVQFDFPDANDRPYKTSGGKMVWNETLKREIPEGWDDCSLIDIANITMGQSPVGSSYNCDCNGMIFYQGSTDFGLRFPDVRQYTTAPTRFAKKGDILMSVRAPVGAINIANNDCCIGRGLAALNSKIGSVSHLYYVINDLRIAFERKNAAGTTFGAITKDELCNLSVLKPSNSVLSKYESICKEIFDKQMVIGKEMTLLKKQRDFVLPLFMSGQLSL